MWISDHKYNKILARLDSMERTNRALWWDIQRLQKQTVMNHFDIPQHRANQPISLISAVHAILRYLNIKLVVNEPEVTIVETK